MIPITKFLCICFLSAFVKISKTHESKIADWSEEEFKQKHNESKNVIVMFFAPWCGHCKQFMPTFDQFIQKCSSDLPDVSVGKLDGTKLVELGQKYHVTGYPTILMIRQEKVCQYSGERDIRSLTSWAKGLTSPSVIDTQEKVDSILSSPLATVLVYVPKENSELENIISDLICQGSVTTAGGLHFIHSLEWAEKLKLPSGRNLIVLKADSEPEVFTGELSSSEISSFLAFSGHPLVMQYSTETSSAIFHASISHYFFLNINKTDNELLKKLLPTLNQLAKEYFGKIRVSWVDVESEDGKSAMNFFGIHRNPSLVILNYTSGLIYADTSSEVISGLDNMKDFTQKYFDGKLKSYRKEEPIPDNWNVGPVYQLVAGNFQQVLKWQKPVFVMFYAPWCGHCKSLLPDWEKLASEYYKPDDKGEIIIAKLDATKNDIESIEIDHFPTLIAFLANGTRVPYEGERNLQSLKKFIDSGFSSTSIAEESATTPEPPTSHEDLSNHDEL